MKRSKDLYIPYRTQLIIADPNSVNLKAKTKDGTFLKYPKKTKFLKKEFIILKKKKYFTDLKLNNYRAKMKINHKKYKN